MKKFAIVCLAAAFLTLTVAPAAFAASSDAQESLVKLIGMAKGTAWGRNCLILNVVPVFGGGGMSIVVPNNDSMSTKFDPSTVAMKVLSDAKPGDILKVKAANYMGKMMLQSVTKAELKPGEEEPNVFIFGQSTKQTQGKNEVPAVEVTKFARKFTFLVPMVKGSDGKMAPSEEITKAIEAAKADDSVEIQIAGGGATPTMKSFKPYEAPKRGTFVQFVAKQKTGDVEGPAVEIKDESGTSQTLAIAKKDSGLAGKARGFKADAAVMYKTTTDDKGTWLTDIRPAPKEAPAKN